MFEELLEKLRKAGLTGNESKVYLELLQRTELSANDLAKNISMDRTLTYTVLNNLIHKGLVGSVVKNNKKYFNSLDPDNLLHSIYEKTVYIQNVIKDLRRIQTQSNDKQEIVVYEGKEGVRSFGRLLLKHKKMMSFGATGRAYDLLYESPVIAKEMVQKGYSGRIITSLKYSKHPMHIKNFVFRYLDIESDATTTIFGDYVAIHIIKDVPSIIVIKNKFISESYKAHFEILWECAKEKGS
ncbi:MAG: TrmB family transcriptional regulator [Candidatus Woesearchaeota archaeon]